MVEEDPFALEERRQKHAFIAALLTIVVWGANFSVQKFVFGNMTPAGFLFARYLLMPVCAFALLVAVGRGRLPRFPRGER